MPTFIVTTSRVRLTLLFSVRLWDKVCYDSPASPGESRPMADPAADLSCEWCRRSLRVLSILIRPYFPVVSASQRSNLACSSTSVRQFRNDRSDLVREVVGSNPAAPTKRQACGPHDRTLVVVQSTPKLNGSVAVTAQQPSAPMQDVAQEMRDNVRSLEMPGASKRPVMHAGPRAERSRVCRVRKVVQLSMSATSCI